MNNKTLKFLIIGSIVFLIACIFILLMLINMNKDMKEKVGEDGRVDLESDADFEEDITGSYAQYNGSITYSSYFDINTCISKYLSTINLKNSLYYGRDENSDFVLILTKNEIKQKIYNLLSKSYIEENNITIDNLQNYVEFLDTSSVFVPLEISLIKDDDVKSFLVHGMIEAQTDLSLIDEIFAIINIDAVEYNFSIEPIYGSYSSISEITIDDKSIDTIEINEDNHFIPLSPGYEEIAKDYINLYKRITLGNPEWMYNLLDSDYKEAKFGSLESFKEYVEKNKDRISKISLTQYNESTKDDYEQFVCVDQNGSYYIFRQNGVMDYTVILDIYTIDIPEFLEQYNNGNEQTKIKLNIENIVSALNDKDYKYIYNKLDSTFKNNNFSTVTDLQKYIEKNFFDNNAIEYSSFSQEGDIYIYKTKITEKGKYNSEEKLFNIIMQLGEGTDFTMSFSFE